MSKLRFDAILEKIAYIETHKEEFQNPEFLISGLENLLLTI